MANPIPAFVERTDAGFLLMLPEHPDKGYMSEQSAKVQVQAPEGELAGLSGNYEVMRINGKQLAVLQEKMAANGNELVLIDRTKASEIGVQFQPIDERGLGQQALHSAGGMYAGGALGALGGAAAGGALGAKVGSIGGPLGVGAGALAGTALGAGIGAFSGHRAGVREADETGMYVR